MPEPSAVVRPLAPSDNAVTAARLRTTRFEVDDAAGRVRFFPDSWRGTEQQPVDLALPGRGSPALAEVVRATYRPIDLTTWFSQSTTVPSTRLWLVDDTGRVAARGAFTPDLEAVWPDAVLAPLADRGVRVDSRRFGSIEETKSAYRGALPLWWLLSKRTIPLVALAVAALVVGAVFLVAALSS